MAAFRNILLFCAGLILTGCETKQDELSAWMNKTHGIKVCTTTPLIADTVKQIGGDEVAVISLMGPDVDPHSYEIVKGDQDKLLRADTVFANGLSLEHSRSMQKVLGELCNVVYVSESIPRTEIITIDGSPDPHIWMDIELWAQTTFPIVEALSKIDPKNAEVYKKRGEKVRDNYKTMDRRIKENLQSIPAQTRRLVTSHDAFNYFAKQYLGDGGQWRDRLIAIQGLAPEEQISSIEIKRVVEYVKKYDVKVIFAEKNLSRDSLLKVIDSCRRSGKKVNLAKEELYGDTMGGNTYLEMMQHNTHVIESNLKQVRTDI